MNRREFFTRVSTGLVGAALATRVPLQWLPTPVQKFAALEYLRHHVNTRLTENMVWNLKNPTYPTRTIGGLIVHPWLYEQAESEMVMTERFSAAGPAAYTTPWFYFKGIMTMADKGVEDPRHVHILTRDEWARHLAYLTRKV